MDTSSEERKYQKCLIKTINLLLKIKKNLMYLPADKIQIILATLKDVSAFWRRQLEHTL